MQPITPVQWILGTILLISSLGVISFRNPVHSCLSFLLTLLTLSAIYLQLSAQFIAVIQVLVYAGAILVIFMFVIILFQDAHQQIYHFKARSLPQLLFIAATAFVLALGYIGIKLTDLVATKRALNSEYGTVQAIGQDLYTDFFFPFEAVTLLFLVAVVGALYIGKKEI